MTASDNNEAVTTTTECHYTMTGSAIVVPDRRRPGRLEAVSPHLLPLMRQSERDEFVDPLGDHEDEDAPGYSLAVDHHGRSNKSALPHGSGLALGVISGSALWFIVISLVYAALSR